METFYIAPGIFTPEVDFESGTRNLFFKGRSYPSDPSEFYRPVFNWILSYLSLRESENDFCINFKLDYYNTSTSKEFAKLFKLLEENKMRNFVKIKWLYHANDLDMFEAGRRFSQFTSLNFAVEKSDATNKK